jgi:hypothetical protein
LPTASTPRQIHRAESLGGALSYRSKRVMILAMNGALALATFIFSSPESSRP